MRASIGCVFPNHGGQGPFGKSHKPASQLHGEPIAFLLTQSGWNMGMRSGLGVVSTHSSPGVNVTHAKHILFGQARRKPDQLTAALATNGLR